MISITSWNIRGLNRLPKQQEVQEVVRSNNLSVCAILESHVAISKLQSSCSNMFGSWYWTVNNNQCVKGTRIIIGWDLTRVDVMTISQTDQVLRCMIKLINDNKTFYCSFIYAGNLYWNRKSLWKDLDRHKLFVNKRHGFSWVILMYL